MKNVGAVRVACVLAGMLGVTGMTGLVTGCSDSDGATESGASSSGGPGGAALPAAIDGFTWADPPAAGDVKSNPKAIELAAKDKDQNESVFECTSFDHDARGAYDKIVWLSEESGPVKPGMVLQGKAFREGRLSPLPVKRTPIKISIDLAVPTASRTIESPDTASIQDAISKFQQEADQLSDTPGNIERTVEEVTTKEEISLSLGVHASYSGLLSSAHLDTNITHEMGLTQHTVVARLVQPMYTVTFADEALPTAQSFFDPSLSEADWKAQADAGTISADNPPVFISSVTYGRMVMVSLSSTQGQTRDELKALIEGSTVAFSASASVDAEKKKEWSTLKHQEFQRGGSANGAAEAMQSGDFSKFFGKAPPSTMVPISFTVKTLSGSRKVARIGDLTRYNAPDCQTNGQWKAMTQISEGSFNSIGVGNNDDVWATNQANPKKIYHFDKTTKAFTPVDPTFDPAHDANIQRLSVGRDGTVGLTLADHSVLVRQAATGAFVSVDQCKLNFDCNNGDRQLEWLDVFDANHMAATNHEDVAWTTDGYANKSFFNSGQTGIIGIDQFNKAWMASEGAGIYAFDLTSGAANNVGNLPKRVDSVTVGAPNDVWITYDGGTFHYDPTNEQSPWKPMNMGTVMTVLDVGVDGHLWGISADGRVHRWLGLRP